MTLRALALALALLSLGGVARAQGGDPSTCHPAVHAWASRCSARGLRVEALQCPNGAIIIVDAAGLRVELARDPRRGFRRAGPWGISPIGSFSDWNAVAPALRAALDQVVACAGAAPLPAEGEVSLRPSVRASPGAGVAHHHDAPPAAWQCVPWLVLGALALSLAARGPLRPRLAALRTAAPWRRALTPAAIVAATLALRAGVSPAGFFHQNGHGPSWVAHTFTGEHHAYGTGFREVFGAVVRLVPSNPDGAVFALQSLLGAAAVAALWATARAMGAPQGLCLAAAFAAAVDPVLARASRSESHYAAQTSLLFIAAAMLARASGPVRSRAFALACAAAGLVLAQAMRMHPVAWVAAALVPSVMLLGPDPLPRRVARTAAGFALAGATCALFALPTVRAVMAGQLGAQWAPRHASAILTAAQRGALPALAAAVAAGLLTRSPGSLIPRALTAVLVCAAAGAANVLPAGGVPPWVSGAYARLYAPVVVAAAVAVAAEALTTRARVIAASGATALGALLFALARGPALTHQPTDAREQRDAMTWRAQLPAGSRVVYLERAGDHIVVLPLYAGLTPRGVHAVPLRANEPPPVLSAFGPTTYWYRSSVCSSRQGAAWCDAIERANAMTPLWAKTLPASPSMPYLPYLTDRVRVGLSRVTAR